MLPDANIVEIRRWHALHRDPADAVWRIVDVLLDEIRAADEATDRAADAEVSGYQGEIDDLEEELDRLKDRLRRAAATVKELAV